MTSCVTGTCNCSDFLCHIQWLYTFNHDVIIFSVAVAVFLILSTDFLLLNVAMRFNCPYFSLNQNIGCSSWPGETSAEKLALKSRDIWKSPGCLPGARFALGRLHRFRNWQIQHESAAGSHFEFKLCLAVPALLGCKCTPLDESSPCSVVLLVLALQYFPGFKGIHGKRIMKKIIDRSSALFYSST